jgi:hypothetical protein
MEEVERVTRSMGGMITGGGKMLAVRTTDGVLRTGEQSVAHWKEGHHILRRRICTTS